MPAWLKWAVALVLSGAVGVGTQLQLEKAPPPVIDVNMLFVPPKQLAVGGATGYQNMIADGLWLGLLQYYGDRLTVDQAKKTVNLPAMFDLITDLDPQFWFAYWLGGWAIGDSGDHDGSVALLKKGQQLNPQDYNYPYILGFVYFLFKHDYPAAARSFTEAATFPEAPRFAQTMAARMYQHEGQDALALNIWRNLYEKATDKATKQIAKSNVERIEAEMKGLRPRAMKIKVKPH
jgi:tetratricopeptide (TPR) repeat protein